MTATSRTLRPHDDTGAATRVVTGGNARPAWSVVVITRNEEENIGGSLRSIFEAFAARSVEVILVDSASTDRTVEIAREFPVTIVCLAETMRLNPAVGRYVGYRYARGEYILFLDGDCSLEATWVDPAEQALQSDPVLGGVAGSSYGLLGPGPDGEPRMQDEYPNADYDSPLYLAGSAAYKREVLERVGGFNPNLYSCEEEEFGARVRKGGYRMLRLRQTMSQHHPRNAKETVSELFRRVRRRYFVGLGQLVRHIRTHELPIERPNAPIDRHIAYFGLLLAGVAASLLSLLLGNLIALAGWATLMTAAFAAFAIRARGLRKPAYYFLEWTVASPMVVYGLLLPPHSAEQLRSGQRLARVLTPGDCTDVSDVAIA